MSNKAACGLWPCSCRACACAAPGYGHWSIGHWQLGCQWIVSTLYRQYIISSGRHVTRILGSWWRLQHTCHRCHRCSVDCYKILKCSHRNESWIVLAPRTRKYQTRGHATNWLLPHYSSPAVSTVYLQCLYLVLRWSCRQTCQEKLILFLLSSAPKTQLCTAGDGCKPRTIEWNRRNNSI